MKCARCGETNPDKFYGHKKTYCAKCHNEYTIEKRKDNKAYAINKFGGKCAICGFDAFQEGLSFHHVDPSIKDPKFANMLNWSRDRIDKELEGCILLCLTCHAGVHANHLKFGV